MLALYTLTLFLSAALLFVVQPMFARLVLPLLGGSPGVWNTTQVFFQAALLAGYAYAYVTSRWLTPRKQILLHVCVLLAPLLVLPIAIPTGWTPPATSNPVPWLLALLTISVGLPFFVVSTSGRCSNNGLRALGIVPPPILTFCTRPATWGACWPC
jgi:hypothetical protein